MQKFQPIKQKFLLAGIKEDNINYAIDAVLSGTKRAFIIENLTASYRGMTEEQSNQLLDELFTAYGGEFKKENRGGYLFGFFLIIVGIAGVFVTYMIFTSANYKIKYLIVSIALALFGLIKGPALVYKSIKGNYRDGDSPFENE